MIWEEGMGGRPPQWFSTEDLAIKDCREQYAFGWVE